MTYIYDLETYPNFFLASFKSIKTNNFYEFEISDRKSQLAAFIKFLNQTNLKLIGFNNLNFDYPVLHNTILSNNKKNWTCFEIYEEVINIINTEYSSIWDNKIKIPQLDLFKIWHYDNVNKSCSLKWLEFAMRMHSIEDLPFKVGTHLNNEQKDIVLSYCRHDLNATHDFFNESQKHIKIRQFYTKQEGINLINASEIKLSKEIFGKYLSKEMGITTKQLSKLRTFRSSFKLSDVILDYIEFKDPLNIKTLNAFKDHSWVDTSEMSKAEAKKYLFKHENTYLNVKRVYAEGGLHSFGEPGIYSSDDEYMIYDLDFASYYPHLSFVNGLHPEHIPGEVFNKLYKGFYTTRKEYPKSDPRNYVLKIILNGSYGLSKDKFAYLYDPKWQMAICVNGQLLLTMLTERVVESTSFCEVLFENTDGVAVKIKRSEKHLVDEACKKMEELSGIALEAQECERLIMRDVNNYINIISGDNIKFKGCFEIDRDFHKNHSKRIVAIALADYFINGNSPDITLNNHLNLNSHNIDYTFAKNYGIFDFCIGAKMKGDNSLNFRTVNGVKINDDLLTKTTRYFVSNEGGELIKKMPPLDKNYLSHLNMSDKMQTNIFDIIEDETLVEPKDRETNIESGWKTTIFNKYFDGPYDINYKYYLNEVNKILNLIK